MTNEVTLAMWFAQAVAVWHLAVALYLIGFAEKKSLFLMVVALLKALLGTLIYLIVLEPEWAFLGSFDGLLLPLALVVLGIISVVFTWLLWQVYSLDNPAKRLFRDMLSWIVGVRNAIRRFTR